MHLDVIVRDGLWFDGTGAPPQNRHLGIRDGKVAVVSREPLSTTGCDRVIDAHGKWVVPGFLDVHTHYDAEILVSPGLPESVRHGVTTVILGSCSLSTIHSSPLDCADLFSRVEAVPRDRVLSALEAVKTWNTALGYIEYLESLPLGPNIAAFLGHSDVRTSVMGLGRAVDPNVRPDESELAQMEALLRDAIGAGLVGLSSMTTPWDKLDGDRYRSKSLPSTFATWGEYRRLNRVLRQTRRVLQSAPNTTNLSNALLFYLESSGFFVRPPLRTSLLVAADGKAMPSVVAKMQLLFTRLANQFTRSDLRWQHVPVPFEVYADGIDFVVFEEFGAGQAALHLKDEIERNQLLQNEGYRRQFRHEVDRKFDMRVWSRDFYDTTIVACPDPTVIGKSFGQVADERHIHPVDAFLDLVVAYGQQVRWRMTVGNHRPDVLNRIAQSDSIQMGFSDSGAHLRNMAFYNFPVRFLKRVHDAEKAGAPFLSPERAVHRLTGELAAFYGLDAGILREGSRADLVVVDPQGLDDSVDAYHEAPIEPFGGLMRMVNRSDAAVRTTVVGGHIVFENGEFVGSGRTGRFLRAGESAGTVDARVLRRSTQTAA